MISQLNPNCVQLSTKTDKRTRCIPMAQLQGQSHPWSRGNCGSCLKHF